MNVQKKWNIRSRLLVFVIPFTPVPISWRAWRSRPNIRMNTCGQDVRHSSFIGLPACRHNCKILSTTIGMDSCWHTFTNLTDRGVGADVFWSVGRLLILAVTRDKALNSLDPRISMHADKGRNPTHYSRLFLHLPFLFFFFNSGNQSICYLYVYLYLLCLRRTFFWSFVFKSDLYRAVEVTLTV
jgi:hypothetical protein